MPRTMIIIIIIVIILFFIFYYYNSKHVLGSYQSLLTFISGYKTYCTAAFIGEPTKWDNILAW